MDLAQQEWKGDNPYFLLIVRNLLHQPIDLDEKEWATTYADLMRQSATWHLIRKDGLVIFSVAVHDGEQPYYTAKHVGIAPVGGDGPQTEILAYGIGKKRKDGHTDRLWVMPNGQICGGDDVYDFARAQLVAQMEAKMAELDKPDNMKDVKSGEADREIKTDSAQTELNKRAERESGIVDANDVGDEIDVTDSHVPAGKGTKPQTTAA